MFSIVAILIIIIFVILTMFFSGNCIEKYESIATDNKNIGESKAVSSWNLLDPIKYEGNCYNYTGTKCLKFRNCGLADGKCVPGDYNGPYFKANSKKWIYRDINTQKIKLTKPYNKMIKCGYFQNNNFVGI